MAVKAKITREQFDALPDQIDKSEIYNITEDESADVVLHVTPVGGIALDDTGKLKRALDTERAARKKAEVEVTKYKNDDGEVIDPDAARAALARIAEVGDEKDVETRIAEGIRQREADLTKRHTRDIEKITVERDAARKSAEALLVRSQMSSAINKAGGKESILGPKLKAESRVRVNSDSEFVLEILDDAGNPRSGNGPDGNMTYDERLEELKADEDWGVAFSSTGQTGTGKPNQPGNTKGNPSNLPGSVQRVTRAQVESDDALLTKVGTGEAVITD